VKDGKDLLKAYGQIDILVNIAGTAREKAITELEESTWDFLCEFSRSDYTVFFTGSTFNGSGGR
jgi:NAD(P)-dependent dehydrogenase (short-subunit alcohol dehydrogenase family)